MEAQRLIISFFKFFFSFRTSPIIDLSEGSDSMPCLFLWTIAKSQSFHPTIQLRSVRDTSTFDWGTLAITGSIRWQSGNHLTYKTSKIFIISHPKTWYVPSLVEARTSQKLSVAFFEIRLSIFVFAVEMEMRRKGVTIILLNNDRQE